MALPEYKPFKVDYNQLFGDDLYKAEPVKSFWDYDRQFAEQKAKELQVKVAKAEAENKLESLDRADAFANLTKQKLAENPNLTLQDLEKEIRDFYLSSGDAMGLMKMEEEKAQRQREGLTRQREELKFQMEMDKLKNPPMEYRDISGHGLVAVNPRNGQVQLVLPEIDKEKKTKTTYVELINPQTGEVRPVVAGSDEERLARGVGFLENNSANQNSLFEQRYLNEGTSGSNGGQLNSDQQGIFRQMLDSLAGKKQQSPQANQQPIQDKTIFVRRKDR